MSKIVKDLNFEQIVTIYNAICNCRDNVYAVIAKYGIDKKDIVEISSIFDNFINTAHNISDETDYNDAMDLLNNSKRNVLKEREQRYNHQHDKFYQQQ